jgi:hypothetical protein
LNGRAASGNIRHVVSEHRTGAWFEVYPRSQPLSGRYCLGDGQVHEFSTWLELVALVERTWRTEPAVSGQRPTDDPGHTGR